MKYSQGEEQNWAREYFGVSGPVVNGHHRTFLDLGANDGVTLSNTRALWEKGWSGVLVEASPMAYHKLCENVKGRPDTVTIEAAIWKTDGHIVLEESGEHLGTGDTALLSSVVRREVNKWRSTTNFKAISVQTMTVATLLSRVVYKTFDFISIDIEGADLIALEQMDLTTMGCKMLIVEVNDRDPKPFRAHCEKHGLKYVRRNAENLCFIR